MNSGTRSYCLVYLDVSYVVAAGAACSSAPRLQRWPSLSFRQSVLGTRERILRAPVPIEPNASAEMGVRRHESGAARAMSRRVCGRRRHGPSVVARDTSPDRLTRQVFAFGTVTDRTMIWSGVSRCQRVLSKSARRRRFCGDLRRVNSVAVGSVNFLLTQRLPGQTAQYSKIH